jgi:hypothetical protein
MNTPASDPTPSSHLSGHLPRLPREYYQGDAMVHWTLPTLDRARGWLSDRFHARFRERMLHAAAREGLFCPAYCLMPAHLHLAWMGLRRDTDHRNGMAFLRADPSRLSDSASPTAAILGETVEAVRRDGSSSRRKDQAPVVLSGRGTWEQPRDLVSYRRGAVRTRRREEADSGDL